jgi:hypothetical protein
MDYISIMQSNECKMCKLLFENRESLLNHMKNFCVGSKYSDPVKLER